MGLIHCRECGEKISETASNCPKCGAKQRGTAKHDDKNRTTAGILALFLGGFGVHKFYLGDSGKGILYLIFCWTFIPAIIALIEAIQIFSMTDEKFEDKYLR
ncbi:hypothetical protein COY27_06435 [Candidatus Woesearchaeota archaeon CG_4_10_14_0_2_um_filter_33_13]|nr:MAG: hypothetical protein COY27_06435 [Candidatus Woesearchaeota archaeon CG_4_10_14_0_2_um_filter_33_13]